MIPDHHLLTWLTFAPGIGAAVVVLLPRAQAGLVRGLALLSSLVTFALALEVVSRFDSANPALQLVQKAAWIPMMGVDYFIGVDGLSVLMVLLSAVVAPLAILASWSVTDNARTYFFLLLLLQTGMFGVFTALNFFHWFLFWEASLIPAFFLIKMWGGERAHRAAIKFFLYTLVGSVPMLLAFAAIFLGTGTLDFLKLADLGRKGELSVALMNVVSSAGLEWTSTACGALAFGAVLLGFAVKAPLWPFHTWLPDAYAEAPAPTTMLMTGVLSKMGVYGLLRILLPMFPAEFVSYAQPLLYLALITVVAGAFSALAQKDLKRMIAYSSVNHVGYCLLGIFVAGTMISGSAVMTDQRVAAINGAILQMFNHGITASAMFFLIGALEERTKLRRLDDFGGLRQPAPVFCGVFGIVLFSSLGLPGLNGFVSEFLVFKGALALHTPVAVIGMVGILVTAVFLLTIMQRVWWNPLNQRWSKLPDLSPRELAASIAFLAPIFWVGLYPAPFVRASDAAVGQLVGMLATFLP